MKQFTVVILIILLSGCAMEKEGKVDFKIEKIMEDTIMETKVYYYNPNDSGIRFAIVGGIHGNEIAGYMAVDEIMEDIPEIYSEASIMFIPHANQLSIEEKRRYGKGHEDLNRAFTGEGEDPYTIQLASEIKQAIKAFNPSFVIDHHESKNNYLNTEGKYQLGNTVIVMDHGENVMDLIFILDMINEQIKDDIPFKLESNPPHGSFNRTMTEELDIFVATIETNRQLSLEKRIEEQKIVANAIINYFVKGQ